MTDFDRWLALGGKVTRRLTTKIRCQPPTTMAHTCNKRIWDTTI